MLVNQVGVYTTRSGRTAYVLRTDGYRRCYGYMKGRPEMEMSWYTEDGRVRHGMACGPDFDNTLAIRLKDVDLPKNAAQKAKKAQDRAYKEHIDRCNRIVESWPQWKRDALTPKVNR